MALLVIVKVTRLLSLEISAGIDVIKLLSRARVCRLESVKSSAGSSEMELPFMLLKDIT